MKASTSCASITGQELSTVIFSTLPGSLKPLPVIMQTIVASADISPASTASSAPTTEPAAAGSQKIPSLSASNFWLARISSSVDCRNQPPDSWQAFCAGSHDCGRPIRIAVAIVSDINNGRFNLLKWDRQEQMYYPLEINLHEKGKIDD